MSIQIGDPLPVVSLTELVETGTDACPAGPTKRDVAELAQGKKIALFAVPGAFTPTCSEKHLPGYLMRYEELKAKGIDEIWCLAVNDAFVMGAWGRDQNVQGRIRMLADGGGEFTRALGMQMDLTERGLGVRSRRYSAIINDGVISQLNVEEGGKLESSDADTLLGQL